MTDPLTKHDAFQCKFDATTPLPNAKLMQPARMKLWAKGTRAGKCSLRVSVEKSSKPEFVTGATATTDTGVVELVMGVHQQDKGKLDKITINPNTDPVETYYSDLKNLALPEQIILSDENKIRQGRLVHVQQNGSFGRAKLVVKQLDGNHLPAGCDDYDIVLNESNTSGAVDICDQEFDGQLKPFPIKVKLSELKKSDVSFWVQGKAATKKWRDVRLDLGLDRAKGGMANTPKRNGDWALFTVVKIRSVAVDYTPATGKAAAWDEGERRFYINFDSDPALNARGDKPVKIPLLICDAQWDTNGNTGSKDIPWAESADFPIDLGTDKLVINPPLQGGDLFVSGTWESIEWEGAAWRNHKNGNLTNGDLTINAGRDSLYKVTVNLPAGAGAAASNVILQDMSELA